MLLDLRLLFDYWLCLIVLCVCCDYLGLFGVICRSGICVFGFCSGFVLVVACHVGLVRVGCGLLWQFLFVVELWVEWMDLLWLIVLNTYYS